MPLFSRALKPILFRPASRHPRLQPLWSRVHTLALFGMNYGGGGAIETSGERWSLAHVARTTLCGIADPIIFDVGAHTGDYAVVAKPAVPSARIFMFEPAPQLSSIPLRRPTQVVEVRSTSRERIQVTTIDNFCRTEGIAWIALLKLDVEGHELAVLRGASRMLDAKAVSIIQFEFGPANLYSRTYFFDFWSLLSPRFDLFRIIPKGLVPIRFYGEHQEIFLTTNYLAISSRIVESERVASGSQELLRAERVVRRPLPLNVHDGEIGLFTRELERVIPPATLQELCAVRISADGLLFKRFRLLPESFAFPALKDQLTARTRAKLLAFNFALRRKRTFEKRGVWITDTWSVGYFHWLTDALSRLYLIRERAAESVLVFPQPYRSLEYAHASLEAFSLGGIEFIDGNEVLLCRKLMVPAHAAPSGHYDEEVICAIRTVLVGRFGTRPPQWAARRVYVSRALARKRRIANEAAVVDALRAREFRIVHSEQLTLRDQVRLYSTADVLVSNRGAGLTNMLFMPEGAKVLELRHHRDAVNNCYFTLAAALRLHYFFQGCVPVDPIADPHQADVVVDVDRLNGNVDLMFRR